MGQRVDYKFMRMTFYVRDGKVIEVHGPSGPERSDTYDPASEMLPEPRGYSATMQAVAWQLTLYVDVTTTQTHGIFPASEPVTTRVYPNPWYMIWRQRLDRAERARPLVRQQKHDDMCEEALAAVTALTRRMYIYIAQMAYEAYITRRLGNEADADRNVDLYLQSNDYVTDDTATARAGLVMAFATEVNATLDSLGAGN